MLANKEECSHSRLARGHNLTAKESEWFSMSWDMLWGLWHEQSRPDRDQYIRIEWDNIELGTENSFFKYNRSIIESFSLPYDYGSIMHYPTYVSIKL